MKKIFKFLINNIIVIPIIYVVIFLISLTILLTIDLQYRQWVYFLSAGIVIITAIIGVYQLFSKLKNYKIFFMGIFTILIICCIPIASFIIAFSYMPEYIIEKDEKKYVAYLNSFWITQVDYYEYKGPFVINSYKNFTEDYGKGGFNPIENDFGYKYEIKKTIYYDANGKIIRCEENEMESIDSEYMPESKKTKSYFNINTAEGVEFQEEPAGCYAISSAIPLAKIISYNEAADIADKEAQNSKYQYQPWKSEFYSRGKKNDQTLDAKLCYGLEEIDRLYMWEESWKISDYEGKFMWQIRLFDENDPLTSLYIYVNAEDKSIVGAGKMSD